MSYVQEVLNDTIRRNPGEIEFHQALSEVLDSLEPVLAACPRYEKAGVLERLVEPDRTILFRVPWVDDAGRVRVNKGYRVQYNNAIGPYKGGLRLHSSVNLSVIKFLGFEQIFKNSLTGLNIGGGKGGSDFDPKGKSEREIMVFCQSFMNELYKYIGADIEIPAGDIGVGAREIGYMFGQYKRITRRYDGAMTGKGVDFGGSLGRTEATGYGLAYLMKELLGTMGESFSGKRVVISGSGNVAIHANEKVTHLGGKVVAMSDSSGWIYDEAGIDLAAVRQIKEVDRGRIKQYLDYRPQAEYHTNGSVWDVPCNVALPCATQNELHLTNAEELIINGVTAVGEGANMPTTAEAIREFQAAGVKFIPGKAANSGGVAASALEMSQNSMHTQWTFDQVDRRLHQIMVNIFGRISAAAEQYDRPGDYVSGANIASFVTVADAMVAEGIY